MALSSESYRALAVPSGFRADSVEKVVRLGELLREFSADEDLEGKLVLRGGTALNLVQARPLRLSVDIDLDYVGALDRSKMLEDRPEVLAALQRIGRQFGYGLSDGGSAHAGTSQTLGYRNCLGSQDSVKVDISWTNRVGIEPQRREELWQPEGVDPVEFTVVGRADLVAGKFRALIDRVAARDVFDAVWIAASYGEAWPPPEVKNAFVFLSGTLDLPLTSYTVDRIRRLTAEDVENNLLPMLSPGVHADHATLVAAAVEALRPMLELDSCQKEFVEALDMGELKPELLFPEQDAVRLAQHPHLRWKVQNRLAHLKKKP